MLSHSIILSGPNMLARGKKGTFGKIGNLVALGNEENITYELSSVQVGGGT